MTLIKYDNYYNDPFSELDRLLEFSFNPRNRLTRFFQETGSRDFRLDIYADDDNTYVIAELPGIQKKDLDIQLHNSVLTITAERKQKKGDTESSFRAKREVTLSDDVRPEKVEARFEDGLLKVTLPKREERKPKAITIN